MGYQTWKKVFGPWIIEDIPPGLQLFILVGVKIVLNVFRDELSSSFKVGLERAWEWARRPKLKTPAFEKNKEKHYYLYLALNSLKAHDLTKITATLRDQILSSKEAEHSLKSSWDLY